MKKFLKRQNDSRENWSDETRDEVKSLIIPPCDLWSDKEPETPTTLETGDSHAVSKVPDKTSAIATQCWAFMGSTGGVGTTTLAIQTAYELTRQISQYGGRQANKKPQVCLIDLDFETGTAAHHLDVQAGVLIEDLSKAAAEIDVAMVHSLVANHKSGISLLAAKNTVGANSKVNPLAIVALLEAACEIFPYVILDLPRHWQGWSLPALGGSNFIGLVSDLTIPSLHVTREKRTEIAQLFSHEKTLQVILNKYERRYFKHSIRLEDAKKALKSDVFATICADATTVCEALNRGEPVGALKADSRFVKDCEKLVDVISHEIENDLSELYDHLASA